MMISNSTDMFCHYPGQSDAQPCFVEIDCENETLRVGYNPEIGSGVPGAVYHGRTLRFGVPALRPATATALLARLAPLAEWLIAGYSCEWNGSNDVGVLDEDATDARDKIESICDETEGDLNVWDAADWLGRNAASDIGVTAATTDEELDVIATGLIDEATADGVDRLEGLAEALTAMRDELRDAE